jgi:hypothetical protein
MSNQAYQIVGYGLSQSLPAIFPVPINGKRAPTANDISYQIGQVWIYNGVAYMLASVLAGAATWLNLQSGGGSGSFSSLTVTPGPISLTGTTTINTSGSAVTTIGTGGSGAVHIGNATGNTAVTGSLSATTSITAGTSITATSGNITATSGNIVLSAAATYISMPGPVFIYSGVGAPSNGLALHVGDMYINTTAATAATRIYVATAASTWTNVTCAA